MPETKPTRWLTVQDILLELDISPRTWQHWRASGRAPRCKRLPNGELRIARDVYERWLDGLDDVQGAA